MIAAFVFLFTPQTYRGYVYVPVGDNLCYYLGSRFYSPKLGRFLNADIHTDTGTGVVGTNMFAYCNNNPVVFIDPTGESLEVFVKLIQVLQSFIQSVLTLFNRVNNNESYSKPLYNTLYNNPSDKGSYNCYGYAIGLKIKNNPGYFSNNRFSLDINVLNENTLKDLRALGYKCKNVGYNYKPSSKETMIALRSGDKDYHYMLRMSDNTWTHKPGETCILKLNGNPWDYPNKWICEYTENGKQWYTNNKIYYNSTIKYIVFWR